MPQDDPLPKDAGVDIEAFVSDLTYHEVHLFVEGFFRGYTGKPFGHKVKVQGTVVADSWYAKGGYVLGQFAQLGKWFLILVGVYVLGGAPPVPV